MIELGDPLWSDREWLQEFRENLVVDSNLVDDRVPEHRDSHASSSHEVSLEPTSTRSADLCKHSVHTHFPKDQNCEICKRTKITRAPCRRRNGEAVPRAEYVGDLITADHKVLSDNCECRNNHRYAVVVQDLATQWIQAYPCKTKTSEETQRSLQKFLEPGGEPGSLTLTIPRNLAKPVKVFSWNHCTSTPHRTETNGIDERAVRRVKEGTSAVLLQSGLDEHWWEDCKVSYLMGRPHMRDVLETNQRTNQSIWFTVWILPLSLRRTSQVHQFGKKVLPGLFLGYALHAESIWKGDKLIRRPWGVGDEGRIWNLLEKTQCERGDVSKRKWKFYFSNRRWTNQNCWRRSRTENIHLGTASTKSRREYCWLSWRIRRISSTTSRLTSGCRWNNKRLLVHVKKLQIPPSRWTQSRTSLAERRIIPYSTEIHWRLENYTYEFGCQTRTPHRRLMEYRWLSRLVWSLDRFHTVYSIGRKPTYG